MITFTKTHKMIAAVAALALVGGVFFDERELHPPEGQILTPLQESKLLGLDGFGLDLRVYEFTPKTSPDMQCIFVSGTGKGGLACFPKTDHN